MNAENREKSKSHRFILNLSQRLEKGSSDKHVAFQNLSIYYTWKNKKDSMRTINEKQ